jgi:hypothetical protein
MKIFFYKKQKNYLGSDRIYIDNLAFWLKKIGVSTTISDNCDKSFDIAILSKFSCLKDLVQIKKNCKKIGIVHPNDLSRNSREMMNLADFFITGSIEERDYFLNYKDKVFRFPQIEIIKYNKKKHKNKKKIRICYHGNLEHLNSMRIEIQNALERLSRVVNLELIAIYDKHLGLWKKNRPNIIIKDIQWNYKTIVQQILNCDIGIVPCIPTNLLDKKYHNSNFFTNISKSNFGPVSRANDYLLQFKIYSNPGRSFVFHQLLIPVIADFCPSNFEILSDDKFGRLAHSENSWYYSLFELSTSADLRNKLSRNAYNIFKKKYDPIAWTRKLIKFLKYI